MEQTNEAIPLAKERHGCVTTWLILIIIVNSLTSLLYIFAGDLVAENLTNGISDQMLTVLALLSIANVIFAILIFRWKKIGFWGFVITSLLAMIINLNIGLGIFQSLIGLLGIAIAYGVLQISKDNVSAWENLE